MKVLKALRIHLVTLLIQPFTAHPTPPLVAGAPVLLRHQTSAPFDLRHLTCLKVNQCHSSNDLPHELFLLIRIKLSRWILNTQPYQFFFVAIFIKAGYCLFDMSGYNLPAQYWQSTGSGRCRPAIGYPGRNLRCNHPYASHYTSLTIWSMTMKRSGRYTFRYGIKHF